MYWFLSPRHFYEYWRACPGWMISTTSPLFPSWASLASPYTALCDYLKDDPRSGSYPLIDKANNSRVCQHAQCARCSFCSVLQQRTSGSSVFSDFVELHQGSIVFHVFGRAGLCGCSRFILCLAPICIFTPLLSTHAAFVKRHIIFV